MKNLIKIQHQEKQIKNQINNYKRQLHKEFVKEHKTFLIFMDVLVVLIVLMNFGAVALTDIMVSEKDHKEAAANNVTVVYTEVNPIASKVNNLQTVEDLDLSPTEVKEYKARSYSMVSAMLKQSIFWLLILFAYIYHRRHVYSHFGLYCTLFCVLWYFTLLGYDFWHDMGLFIGKLLYG